MKNKKFNFTAKRLAEIEPTEKTAFYYDLKQPGLRLCVGATGYKSFQFQMRSRKHGIMSETIGQYGPVSLDNARWKAFDLAADVKSGINIVERKKLEVREDIIDPTVAQFSIRYLKEYRKKNGAVKKSLETDRYYVESKIIPILGKFKMQEVRRLDVKNFIKEVAKSKSHKVKTCSGKTITKTTGGKVIANRVLTCLKTIFNYAIDEEILEFSVCNGIKKLEEKPRERTMNNKEICELFSVLNNDVNHSLIKFLFITGQRSTECREMRWEEIVEDNWVIPSHRTKNGQTHVVPLSSMAVNLLNEIKANKVKGFVFAQTEKPLGKSYLIKRFKDYTTTFEWETKVTPQDVRRTVKTNLARLGIPPHISKKVFNHSDVGMEKVYDKYDYLLEKRNSLQTWSQELRKILEKN